MSFCALADAYIIMCDKVYNTKAFVPTNYRDRFLVSQNEIIEAGITCEEYSITIGNYYKWFVNKQGWKKLTINIFLSTKSLDIVLRKKKEGATHKNEQTKRKAYDKGKVYSDEYKLACYMMKNLQDRRSIIEIAEELELSEAWKDAYVNNKCPIEQVFKDIVRNFNLPTDFNSPITSDTIDYTLLGKAVTYKNTQYKEDLLRELKPFNK